MIALQYVSSLLDTSYASVYLLRANSLPSFLSEATRLYLSKEIAKGRDCIELISVSSYECFIVENATTKDEAALLEYYRRKACTVFTKLESSKIEQLTISSSLPEQYLLAFTEGLALAAYKFTKYKKATYNLHTLHIHYEKNISDSIKELQHVLDALYISRDLVNEPVLFLTAEQLGEEIKKLAVIKNISVEVLNITKIQSLKMGGLLAVNAGSPNPPTFSIIEYKSSVAKNKQPIILVGKGVVYDTGGLSLKPTEHSMDMMKCDMAGAATVIGTIQALATNDVPLHVIGLIPATENRPDGNAITPGDIITMHNGKTVEILNTDAEGRLILADALSFASNYSPSLVIDIATLTGAAVRAVGKEAIAYMGTADQEIKAALQESGFATFERLVEFPLWEDYDAHIKSEIADLKNIGSAEAGAISAGKFLEHFTNYPWLHLDIAGGAFMTSHFHYWPKGGTGIGIRLLYNFLKYKV